MGDSNFIARRRGSIGGSEISGVMGINPYVSPVDIYLEKTGRKEPFKGSLTTRRGNYLEPLVADEYRVSTGYDVKFPSEIAWPNAEHIMAVEDDVIMLHPQYHFLRATADRFAYTPFDTVILAEIKTAVGWGTKKFDNGVPEYYRLQAVWNRGIAGFHLGMLEDVCHIPVLLDDKYDCFDVEYKQAEFDHMVAVAVDFWNNHVLADIPPDVMSLEDCKTLFVDTDGSTVDADEGLIELITTLGELKESIALAELDASPTKESIKRMEERYAQKEMELRAALGSSQYVKYKNKNIVTYSTTTGRSYFDVDSFREAHPELYQEYIKRKPNSRTLRINYKLLGD